MSRLVDDSNAFRAFRGFSPATGSKSSAAEEEAGAVEETLESEAGLRALAEKVYALLKQELTVEGERVVRNQAW